MTIKALYPTVRPTLNLDFAKTKVLDPRITFTRASTATFAGSNGLIQTAASGVPRFDHNPATRESLGLLVEEARTNYLTYSTGTTGWTTGSSSATIAPDGTATAIRINVIGENIGDSKSFTAIAGSYTGSCYARSRTGADQSVKIAFSGITGPTQVVPGSGVWVRIQSNASVSLGAGTRTFNVLAVSGSEIDIDVWGVQAEIGSFPTSYIPTTTATVTRAADVASMTGTNFSSWFNQSSGTFFIDLPLPLNSVANNDIIFSANNGSATDNVLLQWVSTTPYWKAASVQVATSPAKPASSVSGKYALAWDSSSINATTDGNAATSASSSTVPTSSTTLNIFNGVGLSRPVGGTIARLAYYPVRLPDATLQALTAT